MVEQIRSLITLLGGIRGTEIAPEDASALSSAAAAAFPQEEGGMVVKAFSGSCEDALGIKRLLGEGWVVANLAERPDGSWWCCVERHLLMSEDGAVVRHPAHGESCDRPLMAQALLMASLRAMLNDLTGAFDDIA